MERRDGCMEGRGSSHRGRDSDGGQKKREGERERANGEVPGGKKGGRAESSRKEGKSRGIDGGKQREGYVVFLGRIALPSRTKLSLISSHADDASGKMKSMHAPPPPHRCPRRLHFTHMQARVLRAVTLLRSNAS
eukprot:6182883-Pleurochrysis_carterae.AAC.1